LYKVLDAAAGAQRAYLFIARTQREPRARTVLLLAGGVLLGREIARGVWLAFK
jgi:hypothetical protein